jgi:glutamate-5-semialdehyde dehydrogenase
MLNMQQIGKDAKSAARTLRRFDADAKNHLIRTIADTLEVHRAEILAANVEDIAAGEANGMASALLDRLNLQKRLDGVIADVRQVATLPDPVGEEFDHRTLMDGLYAHKRRVPIGVLGVIYESRPNVTVDVAVLALKTSNAIILRGGSETIHSNIALVNAIQEALAQEGFPATAVQLIHDTDRRYVAELLKLHQYVDMIIPRGGAKLHDFCRENSTIPVITGGIGICHLYVDETADFDAALEVIHNAKTQRPSVCNALDTVLVKREIAKEFVPRLIQRLHQTHPVIFKLDPELSDLINGDDRLQVAQDGDFDIEWMDYILGVKVVADLDEAIDHIETHGTAHSDGILTQDKTAAAKFLSEVDSAAVYVNASTRFTDGSALGLGAEVAISTQKLHARGPMALLELTTYKWIIQGEGHIRP